MSTSPLVKNIFIKNSAYLPLRAGKEYQGRERFLAIRYPRENWFSFCLLARLDNYPQISEKSRYDLTSEIDLLWGDFQNPFLSDDSMP